jgi:hypothetical protein
VEVTASDGVNETTDVFTVNVLPVNDPPVVIAEIADMVIDEDPDPATVVVARLREVFDDVEDGAENLEYTISQVPAQLRLQVDVRDVVRITPAENYNLEEGIEVTVTATDRNNATVEDRFIITIVPVNDAPAAFSLVEPEDGYVVEQLGQEVTFEWEQSVDVDGDNVDYALVFKRDAGIGDSLYGVGDLTTSSYTILIDTLAAFTGYSANGGQLELRWFVISGDGELGTISDEVFTINIPVPSGVPSGTGTIPTDFAISGIHPNPFNTVVQIEYSVPYLSEVSLSVWDAAGRRVGTLASGAHSSGVYSVSWSADGLATGVYLFRLESEEGMWTRKAALVK